MKNRSKVPDATQSTLTAGGFVPRQGSLAIEPSSVAKIEQANAAARQSDRKDTPRLRLSPNIPTESTSEMVDQMPTDEELQDIYGVKTPQAGLGLAISVLQALGENNAGYRSFMLSLGAELEPTNAVEAMLITQIGATHVAMIVAAGKASDARNAASFEAYDRIMNRLARTFTIQIEALRKCRSGVTQTVRVEHVTVNSGGQAIVGTVDTGGM